MTDDLRDYDLEPERPKRGRGRRILANLGWLFGGAVLTLILVADPLDVHPVDTWLHELLGHRDLSQAAPPSTMTADSAEQVWTCADYPDVRESGPGTCPVDGTPLVPVEKTTMKGGKPGSGERKILFYRNPMDPTITSPEPMKDSMGMDYVPVYADQVDQAASGGAEVTIDPAVVQNMNVVSAPIEVRDVKREIRTVGYLDYDQQKMVSVTTKYSGFIEKVYVNYLGEPVKKGQALFEIYSPELVQTQEELLSALSFARRLEGAPAEARRRAEALAEAARTRLGYWDISRDQIRKLEETGRTVRTLTVTAPAGGLVMKRMPGLEGMAVKPGMELFHIADLSSLWLSVEVFEDQLPWLRPGSEAEISLPYFPGEVFTGRVRFVEPQVSEKTRTVGLRLEVRNPKGRLRAGMYATVRFTPVVAEKAIAVPSLAVLRTGERNLVILDQGGGRFMPREVVLGAEGDDFVEVRSGLSPGDRVVTSSQFLIDSESNLREAIQKLMASKTAEAKPAATAPNESGD